MVTNNGNGGKAKNGKEGRPPKLTPTVQDKICALIAKGNYIRTACLVAGITQRTYERWIERGEAGASGDQLYVTFVEEIKKAEAEAEALRVSRIELAGQGGALLTRTTRTMRNGCEEVHETYQAPQWQADAWFLERKNAAEWGRRDKVQAEVTATVTLSADEIAEIAQQVKAEMAKG